ncbi:MAG: efflux RND transporter periplasmic adaptor subunit [Candidatus Saccharibacteria bacterium]
MVNHIKLHKKITLFIGLGLVIIIAVVGFAVSNRSSSTAPKISEGKARIDTIAVSVENDGVVTADKAVLNFSQSGTLKILNVKVGDSVQAGDVLAELDSSKLIAQIDQAQSTYSANLEKAKRLAPGGEEIMLKQRTSEAARSALTSEQNIYNDVVNKYGMASSQELAEAAKLRKAEADIASADAQLALTNASRVDAQYVANASYASLQIARTAVYDTKIVAPFTGIITSINGVVGQTLGSSQTGSIGFISIADPESAVLVSSFDEEDIAKIKVDQIIKAEFTSLSATLDGRVAYVSPIAKIDQNGTASYEVRSIFAANNNPVLDGMGATIQFITKQVEKAVIVPNRAVKLVGGKSIVSYYDENHSVAHKTIITGFTDGKSVAVVSGLGAGDQYLITE